MLGAAYEPSDKLTMTVFYLTNYKLSFYCPIFELCKKKLARIAKECVCVCVCGGGGKVCLLGAAEHTRAGVTNENRTAI